MIDEFDWSLFFNDWYRLSANSAQPFCNFCRIRHGRRQANELHGWVEMNDDFFPHGSAVGILQEMHFIQYDDTQHRERFTSSVNHVS